MTVTAWGVWGDSCVADPRRNETRAPLKAPLLVPVMKRVRRGVAEEDIRVMLRAGEEIILEIRALHFADSSADNGVSTSVPSSEH